MRSFETTSPLRRLTDEDRHIAKIAAWMIMSDGEDAPSKLFARAQSLWRAGQSEDAELWQRVADACFTCLNDDRWNRNSPDEQSERDRISREP